MQHLEITRPMPAAAAAATLPARTLGVAALRRSLPTSRSDVRAAPTQLLAALSRPRIVACWGLVVGALPLLGSIPAFVGPAIMLPVLGHASRHPYSRAIG